jgi:hypothetical protein
LSASDSGKQKMYKTITKEIIRTRQNNLKKVLGDFHRSMSVIINENDKSYKRFIKFDEENIVEESYQSDKMRLIITKYIKKIKKMRTTPESGKNRVMKHWKAIVSGVKAGNMDNINFSYSELVNAKQITSYDTNGNILLFYLIEQMNNLIKFNTQKFMKINVIMYIIDFINHEYKLFNMDELYNIKEIRRFTYVLKSVQNLRDVLEKDDKKSGIYDEHHDDTEDPTINDEANEDAQEEQDALDIDGDIDYENVYDRQSQARPEANLSRIYMPTLYVD